MSRRMIVRKVGHKPTIDVVKANGRKNHAKDTFLLVEEWEAIRLKDFIGYDQRECAEKMGVSRQTFQNILNNARFKLAGLLLFGGTLTVSGGKYKVVSDTSVKALEERV